MAYSIDSTTDRCYEGTTCLINELDIRDEQFMIATIFAAQGVMDQLVNCFETMLQPLGMDMDMHVF